MTIAISACLITRFEGTVRRFKPGAGGEHLTTVFGRGSRSRRRSRSRSGHKCFNALTGCMHKSCAFAYDVKSERASEKAKE